jgi:sporulation protein YlmC with PRC-barrel domain
VTRQAIYAAAGAAIVAFAPLLQTQASGNPSHQTITISAELRGAPVFASDGPEVGRVIEVLIDSEGQHQKLQMTIGSELGFGPRTIEMSGGGFTLLRGAVVIDFTAAALKKLPEVSRRAPEK